MNANDADTMLKLLSKTTENKVGQEVLSAAVPPPNQIWATIVAINSKLNTLQQEIQQLKVN